MISNGDHDPLDDLVYSARPSAPAGLAPAVAARMAARRNQRRAAIAATGVLAAAALLLVWHARAPEPAPSPALQRPALAPVADAHVTVVTPPDAAPPGWNDLPALLAELERAHHDAIARCVPAARLAELATFQIQREPDGTSSTQLVIHHSLGYLGYSAEERCLQRVAAALALPALPDGLTRVAFTLKPPSAGATTSAWRDPLRTADALLAPARPAIERCVLEARVPRAQIALVVFEPARGPRAASARARILLVEGSPSAMRQCVARVAAALDIPALPEQIDQILVPVTVAEP